MKHSLFLTILAAALLGSGVANAKGTLYASDYTGGNIILGSYIWYDNPLVVDTPLTLTEDWGYLDLYNGATIQFQKEQAAEAICSILTSADRGQDPTVVFNESGDVYNITFDDDAQTVVAASAGKAITLIQDQEMGGNGFKFYILPSQTTLTLNGAVAGGTVVLDGVSFTYVGPKEDGYTFKEGEIGFKGYYTGSHALILEHGGGLPTPEPTTGSLSLLALAGLCARRRRK